MLTEPIILCVLESLIICIVAMVALFTFTMQFI